MSEQVTSVNVNGILERLSLYSPLIVITSVFMSSIFTSEIIKGIVYLFFVMVMVLLRHTALNPNNIGGNIANAMSLPGIKCNMGLNKYGDDSFLGTYILAFTMMYICMPMFLINDINWFLLALFILYLVADYYAKDANECYKGGVTMIFANGLIGAVFGIIISTIIYTYQNDWSFVNVVSSNKEVCSMKSEQTFRCGVYKNGQLLADTGV